MMGRGIRVKNVLDLLAAGVSEAEILEDFPYLEHDDIIACLEYAAKEVDHPVLMARWPCVLLSMPTYLRPWQRCLLILDMRPNM